MSLFSRHAIFKWILIALFVGWLFYVAGIYFATQKPISPADFPLIAASLRQPVALSAAALGHTALNVLAALWLWAIALGIGGWLWQWLAPGNLTAETQKNNPQIHTDEHRYNSNDKISSSPPVMHPKFLSESG